MKSNYETMAIRVRKNGQMFCAALNEEEPGDVYIPDGLHYSMSIEYGVLVTTEFDYHMANRGEWWWKGREPKDLPMRVIEPVYPNQNYK